MAESAGVTENGGMQRHEHPAQGGQTEQPPVQESLSPTHVLSPASSLDSEASLLGSDEEPIVRVDLSPTQDDQIEKLKEFLSEAQVRGDDYVTQNDADTVKALEGMDISTTAEPGLGARLESAARANLEIEKQTAAGYYPSETVYLQEHTLKEVLDEGSPGISVTAPAPPATADVSSPVSPADRLKSPRAVQADNSLKNELDCLFQERAARLRLE